ncbi:MAG: hypothetical protein ACKO96_17690 [Flammeovirgaceae bacterium]
MNFQVNLTPDFEGQFKRLKKKYRSLPHDLSTLISSLSNHRNQGVALGGKLFKIRMSLSSKGKSGGTRVISLS